MQAAAQTEYVSIEDYLAFRRSGDWKSELFTGANANVPLRSLKPSLPVSAIYEGI